MKFNLELETHQKACNGGEISHIRHYDVNVVIPFIPYKYGSEISV